MKLILLVSLLFAAVSYSSAGFSSTPGGKVVVTQRGIDWVVGLANPFIMASLHNVSLPDQDIDAKIAIHVYLTHMYLQKIKYDTPKITMISPNLIKLNINNLQGQVVMDWRYKDCCLIDWRGTADDPFSGVNVEITMQMESQNGKLSITVKDVHVDVGHLEINLHGGHSEIFGWLVDLLTPLLKKIVGSKIGDAMKDGMQQGIAKMLASIPIDVKISNTTNLYIGLINNDGVHGLQGHTYTDNHFDAGSNGVVFTNELNNRINVDAYHSFDVNGYVNVAESGTYTFQLDYRQRAQLDINGESIGSLEMHNPGMCWIQTTTKTTNAMTLKAGEFIPLRLRYQSGCGGGWVELRMCKNGACNYISPLVVSTAPLSEQPVVVTPDSVQLSSALQFQSLINNTECPVPHHQIPSTVPPSPFGQIPMFAFSVDDYVINSLFWTSMINGDLSKHIDASALPASSPIQLNTHFFLQTVPDLYEKYPDVNMTVDLQPWDRTAPTVTISPNGIGGVANFDVMLNVEWKGAMVPVAEFSINTTTALKLSVDNTNSTVTGNMSLLEIQMGLVWSDFKFEGFVKTLNTFFADIIDSLLKNFINNYLAIGFPFPVLMSVIHFTNTYIDYYDHYMSIGVDFQMHL